MMTIEESERSDATDFDQVVRDILESRAQTGKAKHSTHDHAKSTKKVKAHDVMMSTPEVAKKGFKNEDKRGTRISCAPSSEDDTIPHAPPSDFARVASDTSEVAKHETPSFHVVGMMHWSPPPEQSRIPPVGAIAVSPFHETTDDLGVGLDDSFLEAYARGNHTALNDPVANATLVTEEDVVEAKPALEGFQALIHNSRFKFVVFAFCVILLLVIIPIAVVVPKNKGKVIVQESNSTEFECGTALTNQADYRGTINVTENGVPCQPWASQFPNSHIYTPERYPDADLTGNYCT